MCDAIVSALLKASRVVVFTGAGVSAESGIATFREKQNGFWSQYNPMELASPEGWEEDKCRVWAWYEARRANTLAAQPNPGHLAIAQLQEALEAATGHPVIVEVVTQNIDNLHERAGSLNVSHLHGSLFSPRCSKCGEPGLFDSHMPDVDCQSVEPPKCSVCGDSIRPGIVWFGESLPTSVFESAKQSARDCDVMLVVGTSARTL